MARFVGAEEEAAQRGQSGLRAGNGGFDVKVGGNATLIGGVITGTEQAVNDNKKSFQTCGALTTQDIQNQSALEAASVSAGTRTGSGNSLCGNMSLYLSAGNSADDQKGFCSVAYSLGQWRVWEVLGKIVST